MITFHSTRGLAPEVDIRTVALSGLAPDGGLYLPKTWPQFSAQDIQAMRGESYQKIAFRVMQPFMQGAMPDDVLQALIAQSYAVFDKADVTPIHALNDDFQILELFHGPTLAFKDVALQFLGHCFEYFMQAASRRMTIIGATSGDTGSAAIAALANRQNIDAFILYPNKGPSDIQRKQMTCVDAPNIHAIAVEGDFDACQDIVKSLFADKALRERLNLNTVNSINFLRILAQIVYYFFAVSRVQGQPSFVVPTGNFGDIFAGYAAMKCGLPIGRLVVASNSNDILTRFFKTGRMEAKPAQITLSPSMDIQISSNFERFLFDLCDQDATQLRGLMGDLKDKKSFSVSSERLVKAQQIFVAGSVNDDETLSAIGELNQKYDYLVDPHTAVGIKIANDLAAQLSKPVICLATAHPAKFPDTIRNAIGQEPLLPEKVESLIKQPERTTLIPVHVQKVAEFILNRIGK